MGKVSHIYNQCKRGCCDLPGVGEHPGTPMLVFMVILGGIAGGTNGLVGALIGSAAFLTIFAPIYLWGAYERAELSDKLDTSENGR